MINRSAHLDKQRLLLAWQQDDLDNQWRLIQVEKEKNKKDREDEMDRKRKEEEVRARDDGVRNSYQIKKRTEEEKVRKTNIQLNECIISLQAQLEDSTEQHRQSQIRWERRQSSHPMSNTSSTTEDIELPPPTQPVIRPTQQHIIAEYQKGDNDQDNDWQDEYEPDGDDVGDDGDDGDDSDDQVTPTATTHFKQGQTAQEFVDKVTSKLKKADFSVAMESALTGLSQPSSTASSPARRQKDPLTSIERDGLGSIEPTPVKPANVQSAGTVRPLLSSIPTLTETSEAASTISVPLPARKPSSRAAAANQIRITKGQFGPRL